MLDAGCGVGTMAIRIAERSGGRVTAVDIEPLMLERADEAVRGAHAADRVHIQEGEPRMRRAVPYLGYIVVSGQKPAHTEARKE